MAALKNWKTTLAGSIGAGLTLWSSGGDWKHALAAASIFAIGALAEDAK